MKSRDDLTGVKSRARRVNERPFVPTTTFDAHAYWLRTPREPLQCGPLALPDLAAGQAVVEVAACGLCHTDLGFADGSVMPRHPLPLVLGHEVVGTVVDAGADHAALIGTAVLVPAVMPCGACAFCRAGRGNACRAQQMPGNDINGGFATHLVAPAHALVSLEGAPEGVAIDALSVVADAVSTAYQAVRRSGLGAGDVAFVIGCGGVGGFTAQIARALGARVIACDVDATRLAQAERFGADAAIDVRDRSPKDVRAEVHALAAGCGVPSLGWRVFECSGTPAGQRLAFNLLGHAATMVIVGFTRELIELRLSNLMAFDASVHGSWGCPVEAYPEVLGLIYAGKVVIEPLIERAPMSRLNEHLRELAAHRLSRRMVLDPRA